MFVLLFHMKLLVRQTEQVADTVVAFTQYHQGC